MEFSFIVLSETSFTPWPRLSKRRKKKLRLTPELKYSGTCLLEAAGYCFSSFLALRDYTFSASAVRNHWQAAGNVFWINQCTIS